MNLEMLNKIAVILVRLWTTPVFRYGVKNGKLYAQVLPALEPEKSIDDRIKRIDEAREHLISGLSGIDELKQEAKVNKQEIEELRARLKYLTSEKESAGLELKEIRKVTASDINAFQKLAGVPSRIQIAKERFVGFILGLVASLLATIIWEWWPVALR